MKTTKKIFCAFMFCTLLMPVLSSCEHIDVENEQEVQEEQKKEEEKKEEEKKEDEEKKEEPYLRISGEEIRKLEYSGGELNVWVESNTEWVCATEGNSALGLQTDKTKGYGDDVIIVKYASTSKISPTVQIDGYLEIRWVDSDGNRVVERVTLRRYKSPYY